MNAAVSTTRSIKIPPARWLLPILAAAGAGLIVLGAHLPILPLAIIGAVAFVFLLCRNVDWATWLALFLLYSNTLVIGVKFHNLPPLVGLIVPALLALPLFHAILIRRDGIVAGPVLPWVIAYGVVQFLGMCFADRPQDAYESFLSYLQEGIVLYLFVTNAVRRLDTLHGGVWVMLAAGCLMGGVPLIQDLTKDYQNNFAGFAQIEDEPGFSLDEHEQVLQFRLAGPIGEKNRYAQVMVMLLPLGAFCFFTSRSLWGKSFAVLATLLALAGVWLAFSRGAVVAMGIAALWAAWMKLVNRKLILSVMAAGFVGLLLTPHYQQRLISLMNLKELAKGGKHSTADGALKGRATEMGGAALVFLDHPVVGVGPGMFKFYSQEYGERVGYRALGSNRQAHSLPFAVAAENGVLGLICLTAVFWICGRRLFQAREWAAAHNPQLYRLSTAFLFVIALYFTTGLFLHFAFIRYFWILIALADATSMCAERTCQAMKRQRSITNGSAALAR